MRTPAIAAFVLTMAAVMAAGSMHAQQPNPFLGAWNMTGVAPDTSYVYWLEVTGSGGQLTGRFLNRGGSPTRLAVVRVENGELVFQGGQAGKPTGPEYRARIENGRLVGRHTLPPAADAAPGDTGRTVNWVGVRPPVWPAANADAAHTYGTPVALFDGQSLDAFGVQHAGRPMGWTVVNGEAVNEKGANNLVSTQAFGDFRIEAEYKLGAESNSGIYLRGRYELQVIDDFGKEPNVNSHMSIYGHVAPAVNASRPVGEWQTMTAVIVGNRVTVDLNGRRVHDNVAIPGITGGALDANESAPGPIMIQGDHTGVWLRKLVVTPITAPGR